RDHVTVPTKDFSTLLLQSRCRIDDSPIEILAHSDVDDLVARAEQIVEEEISFEWNRAVNGRTGQHEMAIQTRLSTSGRGLSAVVALNQSAPDEQVGAAGQRLGHHKFIVPGLVASHRKARAVVPLHVNRRSADGLREPRQRIERSRPMRETISWL